MREPNTFEDRAMELKLVNKRRYLANRIDQYEVKIKSMNNEIDKIDMDLLIVRNIKQQKLKLYKTRYVHPAFAQKSA